jgi:RNA polymerase sigma-70 factor (ECF subfamily)
MQESRTNCNVSDHSVMNAGQRRLAALLSRSAQGDGDAFAELYAATELKMRLTVAPMVGELELDDVLQDAYLKVWRSAHRYQSSLGSPIAWMASITRNCAVDRLRTRRRAFCQLDEEALAIADDPIDLFALRDLARQAETARKAMRSLPPERAELLAEAYLEEVSREVLALRYNVPISTIKTWLRRSLAVVRAQMPASDCLN